MVLGASRGKGEAGAGKGGDNEMKMEDELGETEGWKERSHSPSWMRSLEAWILIPVCSVAGDAQGPPELL